MSNIKNVDVARFRKYLRGTQLRNIICCELPPRWSFIEMRVSWQKGKHALIFSETSLQHLQAFTSPKAKLWMLLRKKQIKDAQKEKSHPYDGGELFRLSAFLSARIKLTKVSFYIGDIGSNLQYKKRQTPGQTSFRSSTYWGRGTCQRHYCVTSHWCILISAASVPRSALNPY